MRFRVGHHVRLAELRNHVVGIEHAADLQLVLDRPLSRGAHLAGEHRFFFSGDSFMARPSFGTFILRSSRLSNAP